MSRGFVSFSIGNTEQTSFTSAHRSRLVDWNCQTMLAVWNWFYAWPHLCLLVTDDLRCSVLSALRRSILEPSATIYEVLLSVYTWFTAAQQLTVMSVHVCDRCEEAAVEQLKDTAFKLTIHCKTCAIVERKTRKWFYFPFDDLKW